MMANEVDLQLASFVEPEVRVPRTATQFVLSADHEPAIEVDPGTPLLVETELALGAVLQTEDDVFTPELIRFPFVNPTTGPIVVRGAVAGEHVLRCRIDRIEPLSPGLCALVPGLGPFDDWICHRDFGVHSRVMPVRNGHIQWSPGLEIPIRPTIGTIGTAPVLGRIPTVDNGPYGGNMDVQEVAPGATLILPVEHAGGHLFLGDCHAIQGDGELCSIGGVDVRADCHITLDLAARPPEMRWPRIETDESIACVAFARPLEGAFRLAVEELVKWMVADFGFSIPEALMLLGQVVEARCTQVVNSKFTYIAKVDRRYLNDATQTS
jgi:amidase